LNLLHLRRCEAVLRRRHRVYTIRPNSRHEQSERESECGIPTLRGVVFGQVLLGAVDALLERRGQWARTGRRTGTGRGAGRGTGRTRGGRGGERGEGSSARWTSGGHQLQRRREATRKTSGHGGRRTEDGGRERGRRDERKRRWAARDVSGWICISTSPFRGQHQRRANQQPAGTAEATRLVSSRLVSAHRAMPPLRMNTGRHATSMHTADERLRCDVTSRTRRTDERGEAMGRGEAKKGRRDSTGAKVGLLMCTIAQNKTNNNCTEVSIYASCHSGVACSLSDDAPSRCAFVQSGGPFVAPESHNPAGGVHDRITSTNTHRGETHRLDPEETAD
jgi:hypothetical protein